MKSFEVDKVNEGQRLDKFLTELLPDVSRSQIQKLIKAEQVTVNGKKASVHCFLDEGDKVTVETKPKKKKVKIEEGVKIIDKDDSALKLLKKIKIVANEKDYMVIEKPAGLLVHPVLGREHEVTLIDWLKKECPEVKDIGDDPLMRPGIIHRLDREVSGLLVVVKTKKMFEFLKKQFKDHSVRKEYTALVFGKILKPSGVIDFPIGRVKSGGRMASRALGQKGKPAITEYNVIEYLGQTTGERHGYTLLSVRIKTGRTHQIRAHFHALGHPCVGDKLYQVKRQSKEVLLDRVFLHATNLGFETLSDEFVEYKSKLPKVLSDFLKTIS